MSACDYCDEGLIQYCHMCDTKGGMGIHWEMALAWDLVGFLPCDYQSNGYHQEYQRKWLDNMIRYYRRNAIV